MGEGPWDLWRGTDSLLDRLIYGKSARLEGTGILELEEDEGSAREPKAPKGPGRVRFALLCDFEEFRSPDSEAILVRLQSCDEAAFEVIRGHVTRPLEPLPYYRLSGAVSTELGELPIQMNAVTLDSRSIAPIDVSGEGEKISRLASVYVVTVGPLSSESSLSACKVVVPNFVDEATVEGAGVKIYLHEISSETTQQLSALESRGKVLPGSYLEVQRLQDDANENLKLAVNDCGWLLSFYAGRRIQPIAWEAETEQGTVWRIYDKQMVTPIDESHTPSCIYEVVTLEHFLQHAWEAWQGRSEGQRSRLKGAVNSYADVLSATFSTQKLALTTMYLERFRDLMFGSSTTLEEVNQEKQINVNKIAKSIRKLLRDTIENNENLSDDEKCQLVESANGVGPGQVNSLFRKTVKEALLELYERANLEVSPEKLGKFIAERNKVIHGSWDSKLEGSLRTYRLAEYGLNLLEMLLLRLFGYQGEYRNRATASKEEFLFKDVDWPQGPPES